MTKEPSTSRVHLSADLTGIGSGALRDASLVSGLLIAAAGAAGMNATSTPTVRAAASGSLSATLLADACHLNLHTSPESGLALIDVLARDEMASQRALDVFVRRLHPANVTTDLRKRG